MEKLTKAIGGSAVSITVMVPDGTEPHYFEPRAEDMVKLSRSRLFVYNGMGMEHWAEKPSGEPPPQASSPSTPPPG